MRVLHLEDNFADARLIREVLSSGWRVCEITLVATRAEFSAALARGGYDVILADYRLVAFDGLEALELAALTARDVPFIFLTGSVGEDQAVQAMHLGAADFVTKDHLHRLIPAIDRAVRQYGERREYRLADERLRQSEARYRTIFASSPLAMLVFDPQSLAFLDVNEAAIRTYGYSREDFLAMTVTGISLPEPEPRQMPFHREGCSLGQALGASQHRKKDGTLLDVEIFAHDIAFDDGKTILVVVNDITERMKAERRIRELATLLNKAAEAIVVTNLAGCVTFWNSGAERIFGWTSAEALGGPAERFFGPEAHADFDAAVHALVEKDEWRGEFKILNRQGDFRVIETSITLVRNDAGQPEARLTIAADVSERKKLEEQFLRAQRMESLGMLSAGIAHDLNNVLAPIMMGTPALRAHTVERSDLAMLDIFEKCATRGAGLVRQILMFSHGVGGENRAVEVTSIIRDLANVLKQTLRKNISCEFSHDENLWPINGNPTQIHQLLLNLCVNARDAMPSGGVLRLRATNQVLDRPTADRLEGAKPGDTYLLLEVEDTGTGIAPEVLKRIWEPFFTTKGSDQGTGLGLSTVVGIVKNHNGEITVETSVGRGTTFRVWLPVVIELGTENKHVLLTSPAPRGNGELILVVDDESGIRKVSTETLAQHGYRVLSAGDGIVAMGLIKQRAEELAVVVTDRDMPRLDGARLASAIRRLNPRVKILASSGLSSGADAGIRTEPSSFGDAFLAKPYTARALLTSVHQLLTAEVAKHEDAHQS